MGRARHLREKVSCNFFNKENPRASSLYHTTRKKECDCTGNRHLDNCRLAYRNPVLREQSLAPDKTKQYGLMPNGSHVLVTEIVTEAGEKKLVRARKLNKAEVKAAKRLRNKMRGNKIIIIDDPIKE